MQIAAVLLLILIGLFSFSRRYTSGDAPKWDGYIYNTVIERYVADGYSFANLQEVEFPEWQVGRGSYLNRVVYIWTVGSIHRLTGMELRWIYPYLTLFSFISAAILLFVACVRFLGDSWLPSFFAAAWLLLLPSAMVMYEVVAHPEPMAVMLTAAAYLAYRCGSNGATVVLIFLAALTKESAIFLALYIVADLAWDRFRSGLRGAMYPAAVGGAAILGVALPALLVSGQAPDGFQYVPSYLDYNRGHVLSRLAYNFDVLWIPFLIGCLRSPRRNNVSTALLLLPCVVVLFGVTDWWRVWFAPLFFLVLPLAARVTHAVVLPVLGQAATALFFVFLSVLLVADQVVVAREGIPQANWLSFLAVSLAFLIAVLKTSDVRVGVRS